MTATAHSLVGASIAKTIPNPLVALPLAFASNLILDMIPHWDTGTGWHNRPLFMTFLFSGVDVLIGLALGFLIFMQQTDPLYLFIVMFTATLPDWLEAPYIFLGWGFPFSWFYKIQSRLHARDGSIWGIITQLVVVLPIVFLASR